MKNYHSYLLAVGSNINPEQNVAAAEKILADEHTLVTKSEFIVTSPVGYQQQDDFLNGAFWVKSELEPEPFNAYLKEVERRLKRVKGPIKSGPRTIDLDIIAIDHTIVDSEYFEKDYIKIPIDEIIQQEGLEIS